MYIIRQSKIIFKKEKKYTIEYRKIPRESNIHYYVGKFVISVERLGKYDNKIDTKSWIP